MGACSSCAFHQWLPGWCLGSAGKHSGRRLGVACAEWSISARAPAACSMRRSSPLRPPAPPGGGVAGQPGVCDHCRVADSNVVCQALARGARACGRGNRAPNCHWNPGADRAAGPALARVAAAAVVERHPQVHTPPRPPGAPEQHACVTFAEWEHRLCCCTGCVHGVHVTVDTSGLCMRPHRGMVAVAPSEGSHGPSYKGRPG